MGGGLQGGLFEARLPVPEAEAEALVTKVNQVIEQLDARIIGRDAKRVNGLGAWDAPNRRTWEEDFFLAQTDLFAAIDALQAFRADVEAAVEQIRDHNQAVAEAAAAEAALAETPPTGTTTTTTSTSTTTVPNRPGGRS